MEAVEIQTRASAPDKITDIIRAGELLYVIKKEFALGLKLSMLDQSTGGTLVLQATQGKNPFSGKVKFVMPSGQEVARTEPGFLRSANHIEFQGRKYKWYCKSYRTTLHFDLEDAGTESSAWWDF
ncbi:hypothetical protein WJX73_000836 [Symbiochloris irregularis]|uniref:Uncharacterized protein n=1 Tax=Symbiochloris irregularis TaxID=706552 RepID=A0AAW1NVM9_9CHLO